MRFSYAGSTSAGKAVDGAVSSIRAAADAAGATGAAGAAGAHVNLEVPTTLFPADGTGTTGAGTT